MNEGITLLRPQLAVGMPGALVIAAGTEWEVVVRDCRDLFAWSTPSAVATNTEDKLIVYHHTASRPPAQRSTASHMAYLKAMAVGSTYGLPYNFVVMPNAPHRIYYLNDVDSAWPHTYGYNWATAIAAVGNYEEGNPPDAMVGRMLRLADALASMWGRRVEEWQHRDVYATVCPGSNLAHKLPSRERQRD